VNLLCNVDSIYLVEFKSVSAMPLGMQASIFGACPKPGESGRVATGRASGINMRGMMEVGH